MSNYDFIFPNGRVTNVNTLLSKKDSFASFLLKTFLFLKRPWVSLKSSQAKIFPTPLVGFYQIFSSRIHTETVNLFLLLIFQCIFCHKKSSLFPAYYVGESAIQWTLKNQLSQKVQHFNWDKLLPLCAAL